MSTGRWIVELDEKTHAEHGDALLREIAELGDSAMGSKSFDVWNPANPRVDLMPNLRVDGRTPRVAIEDLGGHDGRLLVALDHVLARWSVKLGRPLRREPALSAGTDPAGEGPR